MASLLVACQEALHAATVTLISEVIARVLTMEVNGSTVVYGRNSLHAACQEALRATTPVSEIIAQAPTTRRNVWTVATMVKSVVRGKAIRLMSSASEVRQRQVLDVRLSFRNPLRWRPKSWPGQSYSPLQTP